MAAIQNVQTKFFGLGKGPVRPFARDKCIDAFLGGDFQIAARAAGHNPDALASDRAARDNFYAAAHRARETLRQLGSRDLCFELKADELIFVTKKRLEHLETEGGAQLRVVSQKRMSIERQMRTVNR